MRVFLLPISTRQALIYCQRLTQKPAAQATIVDRITRKATDTWAKWEKAEKGWQKTVVEYGNKGLQRIPYQEWGLKSFPASNPQLQAEQVTDNKKFDLVYPKNIMLEEDATKMAGRLARDRKTLHWNRFIGSMVAMPFTAPFALIPIIPNIPFFYVVYRCWSHWKALKGSDHLDFLVDHRLLQPTSTAEIEEAYQSVAPEASNSFDFVTKAQVIDGEVPPEKMILKPSDHSFLAKSLGVPELSAELERAIHQVDRQLKQEAEELAKATPSIDSKTVDEKSDGRVDEDKKSP